MAENSKIEWTDHTFNPWEGCQKVGPGCDHCYAESRNARFSGGTAVNWGPGAPRRRTSAANWRKPLAWNAAHEQFFAEHGRRQRVFCASLADVFDNAVDPAWRADLFALIEATPHLDWLLLTKRIGNVREMMLDVALRLVWLGNVDASSLPANVWLGATIVNQAEADRDIPKLLAVPARVRFLSMEPLLGPVNFAKVPGFNRIGLDLSNWWVIVGGESGLGARPMHPEWVESIRDQCANAGVPFLFKQWGEWCPRGPESFGYPIVDGVPRIRLTEFGDNGSDLSARGDYHVWMNRAGKKAAGRLLYGVEHNGYPREAA